MRLTLLIPSQILTAPSLLSPKPIHTPMRTTRTVFPRSTLASVLPQTQIARMPRAPARTTFSTLFQRATSISTTSVLLRMIRSLQRPTCLTFKRAPFKTRLVLSSYTNNATMRRTRCLTEIVGLLQSCTCTVSCQLNNPPDARSYLSTLSTVVQSGIQVLIWAGDAGRNSLLSTTLSDPCSRPFFLSPTHADWVCNTAGVQAVVANIQFAESAQFNSASLAPYTVNGVQYGTFKTAGKLSFLNVFGAGHLVSAYQPIVALQAFIQTLSQQPLSST